MSDDIVEIRKDLRRISNDMQAAGSAYSEARRALAPKQAIARMAYAKAYATADTSLKVDDRKSLATQLTHEVQLAADVTEAECDALKMTIKVLSDSLNATQTAARLIRDEMRLSGTEY